jgi:hypothetical protein
MIQGVAGFAGEERELTDGDDAPIVLSGAALNVADLIGKTKARAIDQALAGAAL